MNLGETIATYDLGLALRGESGKFEVISPAGDIYHVICRPNHSISKLEWTGSRTNPQPFMVRKITETVSHESGKEIAAPQRANGAPFLIESQMDDGEPLFAENAARTLPEAKVENVPVQQAMGLELVYRESDSETKRPTAWVALKGESGVHAAAVDIIMTARCTTFNELDAELRKLHAQLDEFRVRARKKFYSAHAAAVSA
jgi:hypothetical protein